MGLFDFLRTKKTEAKTFTSGSYFDTEINDADLKTLINRAISIFQDNPNLDYAQVVDKIKSYNNEKDLALSLYRFIPVAYCRLLIPEPTYSDQFVLFKSEKNQQTYSFSADRIYNLVLQESKNRFETQKEQDKILPILLHSADFNAINEALKDGSELKNLVCSPSYFLQ